MAENARKFDHRIKNPEPHIVAFLTAIDEIRGVFRVGLRMTPQSIINLRKSVLVTSAGASTRIEGSKLSDEEVKKIMQGLSIQKFADRDSQEVQGYLEVLQNVFNSFQTLPLRESTITSLHKELLKYSTKDDLHRGGYKHKENIVGVLDESGKVAKIIFETTPAWQTPAEMTELVGWTFEALEKERFNPLLIIANFIIEFLKIHPFEDGNGRLSRILTNLLLLRSGYPFVQYISHEQIVERRKDEYYLALRSSQATFKTGNDTIESWLNFFLSVIKEQATKALKLVNEDTHDDTLSPKQNEVWGYFTEVADASPSEIAAATGILIPTVRKSLERLVEVGKIKRIGRGRGTRYVKL
ncbi:MAG: Fic family protein [bacterium]|nr:Fic family protein [bacterium]